MKEQEMTKIADRIERVSVNVDNSDVLSTVREEVEEFMKPFCA